jgi:large subunit ribosomal protein L23
MSKVHPRVSLGHDRLHRLILAPIISEKSTRTLEAGNHVAFRVLKDAAKPEIKVAVEKLFNVKVLEVRTLNVKGKNKGGQKTPGRRSDWKKAYVKLAEGQTIDFAAGAKV